MFTIHVSIPNQKKKPKKHKHKKILKREKERKSKRSDAAMVLTSAKPQPTDLFTKLKHLQSLQADNIISQAEFLTRKSQIVDELTGTSMNGKVKTKRRKKTQSNRLPKEGNICCRIYIHIICMYKCCSMCIKYGGHSDIEMD